jgi:hypothetical protein
VLNPQSRAGHMRPLTLTALTAGINKTGERENLLWNRKREWSQVVVRRDGVVLPRSSLQGCFASSSAKPASPCMALANLVSHRVHGC